MKYASFSDKYLKEKEMKKYFDEADNGFETINNWSRDVVDLFKEKYRDFDFKVVITMSPNPSDCKGVDDIQIVVWKHPRSRYDALTNSTITDRPLMIVFSNHHSRVLDCVEDIHGKMAALFPDPKDRVVEIDGKKYRLTEIK